MKKARAFLHRFASQFGRERWEQELSEELESNLELQIRDNLARGMTIEEARRQVLIRLGSMDAIKEAYREQRGLPFLEILAADLRFAIRLLKKDFAFAALATATLALGIGATTIIFAVVNAVLIQPLAYPHSEQLVHLSEAVDREGVMSIAYANFLDWQRMNRVFSSMGAIRPHALTLSGTGPAEQLDGWQVSHDFFLTLGIKPLLGQVFRQDDDRPSATPVVILTHKFWVERFSADPGVLGTAITLDREQYTVIGVLPPNFNYNDEAADVFVPIGLVKDAAFWQNRYGHQGTFAVARLNPGITLPEARNDMDRVAQILQQQYPNTNGRNWVGLVPLREWLVGDVRKPLLILLAAVGLLLLIACTNIANLLLAKGSSRRRELAIRLAIGASRGRLLRQFLTESMMLALFGGAVGGLLAFWGTSALVGFSADALPRVTEIHIDLPVLAFTFGVAVLTGILFGIAPALHTPTDGGELTLKEGERGSLSPGQERMRSGLVVGQIALSLALLFGAGLLIRSFQRVMQVNPGFNSHQLLTAYVVLSANKYKSLPESSEFYAEAIRNIRAIPGVTLASTVSPMPLSGNEWDTDYLREDMRAEDLRQFPNSEIGFLGPEYVNTMQIPLLAGRAFTDADNEHSLPVAIVNQEFARRNWPDQNPIGKRIRLGDPKQLAGPETAESRWQTVVGVIDNVKQYGLDQRTVATVYTPFAQAGGPVLRRDLVIRTGVRDPLSLTAAVRQAIARVDREQALANVSTMDHHLASRLATRQLSMVLLGAFAAFALVLGAIGIYGVVSYWVEQRTREIGIRVALGARRSQVLQLILGRAAVLLGVGLVVGIASSIALARLLQGMLFGVGASDLRVFVTVMFVLSAATTLASYIPARRATRVDPMIALRYE